MLLSSSRECFVLQFDIQKYKDSNIQNYNFVSCFIQVWNLVSHIEGGTQAKCIQDYGAEKDIRA